VGALGASDQTVRAAVIACLLVLLTAPDGSPLWIVEDNVTAIGEVPQGSAAPQAHAAIFTMGGIFYVRETPAEAAKAIAGEKK
jgi:hypothetical protein